MYEAGTTLKLKTQRDPDPETGEAFPYNIVKVVGPSPVSHADKGKWVGPNANGVLITPITNFGSTLDEPYGKLRELYAVDQLPEPSSVAAPKIRVIEPTSTSAGPTPEEVFSALPQGKPPEEGQKRARTPLGEPGGPAEAEGPLGKVEAPTPEPVKSRTENSPL